MMLNLTGASGGNELGQRFAADASQGEVNNVGVAEEVVKERFDRFQRVGSTELKENYPHTPSCARHFPQNPQNAGRLLRTERGSQWGRLGKIARERNCKMSDRDADRKRT